MRVPPVINNFIFGISMKWTIQLLGIPHCKKPPYNIHTDWWFGTFFNFPYIGKYHPNWLIFFRGVETTNQYNIHKVCLPEIIPNMFNTFRLEKNICDLSWKKSHRSGHFRKRTSPFSRTLGIMSSWEESSQNGPRFQLFSGSWIYNSVGINHEI